METKFNDSNLCCANRRTWVQICSTDMIEEKWLLKVVFWRSHTHTHTHRKYFLKISSMTASRYNPSSGKCWLEDAWSLLISHSSQPVSSRFSERPCLKNIGWRVIREKPDVNLWPTQTHTYMCSHIHARVCSHKHRNKPRVYWHLCTTGQARGGRGATCSSQQRRAELASEQGAGQSCLVRWRCVWLRMMLHAQSSFQKVQSLFLYIHHFYTIPSATSWRGTTESIKNVYCNNKGLSSIPRTHGKKTRKNRRGSYL